VIGADPIGARAALAVKLGARAAGPSAEAARAVRETSDGRGADVVVITGGGANVLPWAAGVVRDGGSVHYFAGGGGDALPLSLERLYHRELTITTTYSSSPRDLSDAFALLVAGEIDVSALITHWVPLSRVGEGVDLMRRREALKVFVTP
jgi:L-iditol 2-dehydrogenase